LLSWRLGGSLYLVTVALLDKMSTNLTAQGISAVMPGRQGRVKDPANDKRLAQNRRGPTGQGLVKNPKKDRRLAQNREGPTGQGRVKNPSKDKRLLSNRDGPTGKERLLIEHAISGFVPIVRHS